MDATILHNKTFYSQVALCGKGDTSRITKRYMNRVISEILYYIISSNKLKQIGSYFEVPDVVCKQDCECLDDQ